MKNKKFSTLVLVTTPLLLCETVFALENSYPVIAGKQIVEGSTFLDYISYGFAFLTALGIVIMFGVVTWAGLKLITNTGNIIETRKEIRRSAIGLFLLFAVYLILNTINSALVDPQDINQACINGIDLQLEKTKTDGTKKLDDLCIKTSSSDLTIIKDSRESKFSSCIVKSVIAFPEKDYKGTPAILFDDRTSATQGCEYKTTLGLETKSARIIPKERGAYLYDKPNYELATNSDAMLFFNVGSFDLSEKNFDNKTKSINMISLDYSANPQNVVGVPDDKIIGDYAGAVVFENPGYRGKCLPLDSNNELLTGVDKAIGPVDLSAGTLTTPGVSSLLVFNKKIHQKTSETKSYIYLYAVKDCGKNINKDNLEVGVNPITIRNEQASIQGTINTFSSTATSLPYFVAKLLSFSVDGIAKVIAYEKKNIQMISDVGKSIDKFFAGSEFIAKSSDEFRIKTAKAAGSLPSSFNWNNMHGKNWLTSFKNQGPAGTCWAHAAVGALESQIRLYYNQPNLNLNLSEQMMVDCTNGKASAYSGNELYLSPNPYTTHPNCYFVEVNEDTVANRGVADEACDPYVNRDTKMYTGRDVCSLTVCSDWASRVWKNTGYLGYGNTSDRSCPNKTWGITADGLKRMLIEKGPLDVAGIYPFSSGYGGHAMVLIGYETDSSGATTWIFKNSWGSSGSGTVGNGLVVDGGYLRVKAPLDVLYNASVPTGPFIPPTNKAYWPAGFDEEIKCTDADKDGYCYWGSTTTKPASCAALTCAAEKDCNDADKNKSVYDSDYNCKAGTPPPTDTCIDADKDQYCYWTTTDKPSTCLGYCADQKDCNDADKNVNQVGNDGKCPTSTLPNPNISPAEDIPNPEPDPIFGVGGLYDVCKVEIPVLTMGTKLADLEQLISEQCQGKFQKTKDGKTYDIISFKFGGPAGVVIKANNGNCLYWDNANVEKTGSCVNDIRGSDVYDTNLIAEILGTPARPKSIIVFPKE